METRPITIQIDAEAARFFETLPEEQRHQLEVLLVLNPFSGVKIVTAAEFLRGTEETGSFHSKSRVLSATDLRANEADEWSA